MSEQPQSPPNVVTQFKGINNRIQPTALGLEFQLSAENVLCDNAGYLVRRPGVNPFLSGLKDVYGTRNGRLLAIDTEDQLIEVHESGDVVILATGVTGSPFQWVELGYAFFLQSKTASWVVYPHQVIPWGSLCPPPTAVTYPLGDPISYPPPVGEVIGARRSQMMVGVWEPDRDRSVLYFSRPDFPHEFRLERDFMMIPGKITLLATVSRGIIIGTDRAIFIDPIDEAVQRVADYGVLESAGVQNDQDMVYFWTERGLCRSMPFENLTDKNLAVTVRSHVAVGILPYQGSEYAVISQSGGVRPKQLTRPYVPLMITDAYSQGITP